MQILFGFTDDTDTVSWLIDGLRLLFSTLDYLAASLISLIYQVLFKIADSTIFTGGVISSLVEKIQVVLGVYMLFKLSVSILQYIVNPDMMSDKQNGVGNIIQRIIITLALLTAVVPLHIPESAYTKGDYNYYLKEHGLLFGTLYSLQHRILRDDVIGNIILGKNFDKDKYIDFSSEESTGNAGDMVAVKLLLISMHPNNPAICSCDRIGGGEEKEIKQNDCVNWTAQYGGKSGTGIYDEYDIKTPEDYKATTSPANLYYNVNNSKCGKNTEWKALGRIGTFIEEKFTNPLGYIPLYGTGRAIYKAITEKDATYAYAYVPLVGFILCAFVIVALVSTCVDVAIRALKLVILRIISPIPIISYLEPQGEKASFNAWVKLVTKTYIELFIRLAIIYFIVFLISSLTAGESKLDIPLFDGTITGLIATAFIIIGLFYFAKQAPKFVYDAIGLKYEGPQLFKGLGQLAGIGTAGLGAIGSARASYEGAKKWSDANSVLSPGLDKAKNFGAALLGGISGFRTGINAAANAKDGESASAAAQDAQYRRNAMARTGSTAFGRFGSRMDSLGGGQDALAGYEEELELLDKRKDKANAVSSALKGYKNMIAEEALKQSNYYGKAKNPIKDKNGNTSNMAFNYEKLVRALESKDTNGYFKYDGVEFDSRDFDNNVLNQIKDSQSENYIQAYKRANDKKAFNNKLYNEYQSVESILKDAEQNNVVVSFDYTYDGAGPAIGNTTSIITDLTSQANKIRNSDKYKIAKANNEYSSKRNK